MIAFDQESGLLKTVSTFVAAHTVCASRDNRVSAALVMPANIKMFLRSLKLCRESRT